MRANKIRHTANNKRYITTVYMCVKSMYEKFSVVIEKQNVTKCLRSICRQVMLNKS